MDGQRDPFDFMLAETLCMTVDHMETIMTNDEYLWWRAFNVWRNAQKELEDGGE
jgi:hypothetical protein